MANQGYHEELKKHNIVHLRELVDALPPFCRNFFRSIEDTMESRTRIAYAYDLGVFFDFLRQCHPYFMGKERQDIQAEDLRQIKKDDILNYSEYLSYYVKDGSEYTNDERGKRRKLASLRTFLDFYYKQGTTDGNAATLVDLPKLHEKEIIRLDPDEVAILLDQVEAGTKMTKSQLKFHEKTKVRDLAMLSLLLGTGIRVSECVGLDLNDVDFNNMAVKVRRKGGYEDMVYFGREVEQTLSAYLEQRRHIIPEQGHEDAFFLSLQNRRMAVRSVENMVKKYTSLVTTTKKITPHKLRSTYGTNLYQETGDIYLVADVLGHKDVNTTRKHYAAMKDYNKRKAAKSVRLREP